MATLANENDSSKFLLTAVNILLQSINERPIESENDISVMTEATIAQDIIIETKKEVLSYGWDFNTDKDYEFPQDNNGYINIPANVLDITSTDADLIMRDWRLYSKSKQTAIFDEPKKLDVKWNLDFNSLTHPIRNFITIRAARKFIGRMMPDKTVYGFTQNDEEDAYVIAKKSDEFTGSYNMLNGQYGISNLVIES